MRRTFLSGLTAIVPLVVTIYVIVGLFRFADGILGKFINKYLDTYLGYKIPGLGIILSVLIIYLLGLLIQLSRMRLIKGIESLFLKIPLVNKIYSPIKRIVEFLFFQSKKSFKRVVLVEYPRKGIYSIGFITNESDKELEAKINKESYNIFIPSSPSPLTGFTIVVPRQDVIILDIGIEEGIRLIVSGGVLNPQDFVK
ncbi:MAG: DUF502 domain-containing protein [Candidatus Omnitrophota bacterium]|nr:MAG: DUF502 domain-containing protein [Candidatus Omnitrophota bacterium]RKY36338.1 MAG: DUF502 domain-containing protein [Candidatus Omnitrophota bacterium]RKY45794.1 MAG: DUF502 domain-containing protein [Candidatus Omnitrophota bacterium]